MKTKSTKSECECGCGEATKGGRFKPGHDAKLKKVLVAAALEGSKRAETKLEGLGWAKFLATAREKQAKGDVKPAAQGRSRGKSAEAPEIDSTRRRGGRRKKAEPDTPAPGADETQRTEE